MKIIKTLSLAFATSFFAQNINAVGSTHTIFNATDQPIWVQVTYETGEFPLKKVKTKKARLLRKGDKDHKDTFMFGYYCLKDIKFSLPDKPWHHAAMRSNKKRTVGQMKCGPTYYVVWTHKKDNEDYFYALATMNKALFEALKKMKPAALQKAYLELEDFHQISF